MNYETVVGLEIHVQTKTKSKMFCGCSAQYFGADPNTHTCPTCLGLPGALPVPNEQAIEYAIMIALALNCKINEESKFDRKNYFYPDLPKGYQISQYDQPIGIEGSMDIEVNGESRTIDITRVHQEEDTGKSIHGGDTTLLDFNKSGVPLVEIVTEPDFREVEEVVAFGRKLRLLLKSLGVSNADLEKGQMRFEPNISVREKGSNKLPPYKVEVKNIGSIAVLTNVIEKETERQIELVEKGEQPIQETRGLVDMSGKTVSQRTKETEQDYRYFPEPDIPPMVFTKAFVESIRKKLPKSPEEQQKVFLEAYDLPRDTAEIILNDTFLKEYFEGAVVNLTYKAEIRAIANWVIGDFAKLSKQSDTKLQPHHLAELSKLVSDRAITRTNAKLALEICHETGSSPKEIIKKENLQVSKDSGELEQAINEAINENSQAVKDLKQNPNAIMFLVGQVMQKMKGKADPNEIRKKIEEKLQ